MTKFAALGGTGPTTRKFFYPPDVVATKNFDMVMAVHRRPRASALQRERHAARTRSSTASMP